MEKTIKINSKESFKIDNNVGWTLHYRDQFGHDILPDLMPIMSSLIEILYSVSGEADGERDVATILKNIDEDKMQDALITLSSLEFTTVLNITWAMAKCYDEDIPEVKEWIKQFSSFPLDVVVPQVFITLAKGVVSSKNFSRLQTALKTLQP